MSWRVLVSAPYMQPVLQQYRQLFAEHDVEIVAPPVRERLTERELLQWIAEVDGVICGDDQFSERVLRAAPRLRVISKWGVGTDSIDRRAAHQLAILVANTPGAFRDAVADTVLGYVLCFARQLPWMDRDVRGGAWHKRPGISLREATLGVIGVGSIGRAVIERAVGFGMRTLGNDIALLPPTFVARTGVEVLSKVDLLREADFVSLNCDLNSTSFHLISEPELAAMKSTAYLINTARGPVVDEAALVRALQEGRLAGAALDVFEVEPLPDDSPLRTLDNVLLAPHNANSSPLSWKRVHEAAIENLLRGLRRGEVGARS